MRAARAEAERRLAGWTLQGAHGAEEEGRSFVQGCEELAAPSHGERSARCPTVENENCTLFALFV